jgi:dihydrofolate reductase
MRRIRYNVAISLDGYIAALDGGYDWIVHEPTLDFKAMFAGFDTVLMGRKTFDVAQGQGGGMPGMKTYVCSRTLRPEAHPRVNLVADAVATAAALRNAEGKDIWLMGGGVLFHSLFEAGLVDEVEVGIIPVLLGQGLPFLPPTPATARLELMHTQVYPSGIVLLRYTVQTNRGTV